MVANCRVDTAAGKPVISTAVPDVMRNFTLVVDVARSPQDFIAAVHRTWRAPNQALIQQGIEHASQAIWEAIVGTMRGHFLDNLKTV